VIELNEEQRQRFLNKIRKTETCWEWEGSKKPPWGYGHFFANNKTLVASRVSYELHKGEIPLGLSVCHRCDNPGCVNPDHLWVGSHSDNMEDMKVKGRATRGEDKQNSKLTKPIVVIIRNLHLQGISQGDIAECFGVLRPCINSVILGRRWTHV
jgi:predicted XRE-type DNA-binding protein